MGSLQPSFEPIQQAFQHTDRSASDIWVIYYSLGGTATSARISSFLLDKGSLEPAQQRVLAQSLNEVFLEAGLDHPTPYPRPIVPPKES
jgi:hypothetical protein